MGNVLKTLAKSVLIPIGLTVASGTDVAIHKKMFGSGTCLSDSGSSARLIISNEEMSDFMEIIKSL